MASLGNGLITLSIFKRLKSELKIGCSTPTVAADVVLLLEAASKLGMKLHISNCEIIADDDSVTRTMKIFDGFGETPQHEVTLLGAPILKGKPSRKR